MKICFPHKAHNPLARAGGGCEGQVPSLVHSDA